MPKFKLRLVKKAQGDTHPRVTLVSDSLSIIPPNFTQAATLKGTIDNAYAALQAAHVPDTEIELDDDFQSQLEEEYRTPGMDLSYFANLSEINAPFIKIPLAPPLNFDAQTTEQKEEKQKEEEENKAAPKRNAFLDELAGGRGKLKTAAATSTSSNINENLLKSTDANFNSQRLIKTVFAANPNLYLAPIPQNKPLEELKKFEEDDGGFKLDETDKADKINQINRENEEINERNKPITAYNNLSLAEKLTRSLTSTDYSTGVSLPGMQQATSLSKEKLKSLNERGLLFYYDPSVTAEPRKLNETEINTLYTQIEQAIQTAARPENKQTPDKKTEAKTANPSDDSQEVDFGPDEEDDDKEAEDRFGDRDALKSKIGQGFENHFKVLQKALSIKAPDFDSTDLIADLRKRKRAPTKDDILNSLPISDKEKIKQALELDKPFTILLPHLESVINASEKKAEAKFMSKEDAELLINAFKEHAWSLAYGDTYKEEYEFVLKISIQGLQKTPFTIPAIKEFFNKNFTDPQIIAALGLSTLPDTSSPEQIRGALPPMPVVASTARPTSTSTPLPSTMSEAQANKALMAARQQAINNSFLHADTSEVNEPEWDTWRKHLQNYAFTYAGLYDAFTKHPFSHDSTHANFISSLFQHEPVDSHSLDDYLSRLSQPAAADEEQEEQKTEIPEFKVAPKSIIDALSKEHKPAEKLEASNAIRLALQKVKDTVRSKYPAAAKNFLAFETALDKAKLPDNKLLQSIALAKNKPGDSETVNNLSALLLNALHNPQQVDTLELDKVPAATKQIFLNSLRAPAKALQDVVATQLAHAKGSLPKTLTTSPEFKAKLAQALGKGRPTPPPVITPPPAATTAPTPAAAAAATPTPTPTATPGMSEKHAKLVLRALFRTLNDQKGISYSVEQKNAAGGIQFEADLNALMKHPFTADGIKTAFPQWQDLGGDLHDLTTLLKLDDPPPDLHTKLNKLAYMPAPALPPLPPFVTNKDNKDSYIRGLRAINSVLASNFKLVERACENSHEGLEAINNLTSNIQRLEDYRNQIATTAGMIITDLDNQITKVNEALRSGSIDRAEYDRRFKRADQARENISQWKTNIDKAIYQTIDNMQNLIDGPQPQVQESMRFYTKLGNSDDAFEILDSDNAKIWLQQAGVLDNTTGLAASFSSENEYRSQHLTQKKYKEYQAKEGDIFIVYPKKTDEQSSTKMFEHHHKSANGRVESFQLGVVEFSAGNPANPQPTGISDRALLQKYLIKELGIDAVLAKKCIQDAKTPLPSVLTKDTLTNFFAEVGIGSLFKSSENHAKSFLKDFRRQQSSCIVEYTENGKTHKTWMPHPDAFTEAKLLFDMIKARLEEKRVPIPIWVHNVENAEVAKALKILIAIEADPTVKNNIQFDKTLEADDAYKITPQQIAAAKNPHTLRILPDPKSGVSAATAWLPDVFAKKFKSGVISDADLEKARLEKAGAAYRSGYGVDDNTTAEKMTSRAETELKADRDHEVAQRKAHR